MKNIALTICAISFVLLLSFQITDWNQPSMTDKLTINKSKSDTIAFSGRIGKGETYKRQISEELHFRLDCSNYGWVIWIGNITNASDYSMVATPPYRGLNSTVIEGWHFRNENNTGSNDNSINTPQETRLFQFVLNEEDYTVAEDYVHKVMWSYRHSQASLIKSAEDFDSLPLGRGKLTITEMEFDNYTPGEKTGFKYINFEVEINLEGT